GFPENVLGRQDLELDLVDGKQVLDILHFRYGVLDLAVDDVLDRERVDGAPVGANELAHQLRGIRERRVDHRQVDLCRREDDEAAIDSVRIQITRIATFFRDLRRKAGAVDLETRQGRRGQAKGCERLVVAFDKMRLIYGQKTPIDQFVLPQERTA